MTTAPPGPDTESAQVRSHLRRYRLVGIAVAAAVAVAVIAVILVSRPAGPVQKRADFTTMLQTLRSDLSACSAKASAALSAWRPAETGVDSKNRAVKAAQAAARACTPGTDNAIFELTLYSLPTSLSGLHLNYAVSSLGVWAQEDVAPAMRDEEILLADPTDKVAGTTYQRLAGWAGDNLAAANSTLRQAARRLGVTHFTPIQLTSIQAAGLLAPPR